MTEWMPSSQKIALHTIFILTPLVLFSSCASCFCPPVTRSIHLLHMFLFTSNSEMRGITFHFGILMLQNLVPAHLLHAYTYSLQDGWTSVSYSGHWENKFPSPLVLLLWSILLYGVFHRKPWNKAILHESLTTAAVRDQS